MAFQWDRRRLVSRTNGHPSNHVHEDEMVAPVHEISFVLNNEQVTVTGTDPNVTLNEWIRSQPRLSGTKQMCGEGGCGCCVVTGVWKDPASGEEVTAALNSCLCPLYSVNGWKITTVEGIGSSSTGYHPVQERIAQYHGSQCGYCTPGFVMTMYSCLQNNPNPSRQQVEDSFDGNICRCTGYRPILDAMGSFAGATGTADIEDLSSKLCPKTHQPCKAPGRVCAGSKADGGTVWFAAKTVADIFTVFAQFPGKSVKLIGADTGRGIYKTITLSDVIVDLKQLPELCTVKVSASSLLVGACVTLTQLIEALQANADKSSSFPALAEHLLAIANVPVRNVGTWAGNLMLTHSNDNFPSDVYTIMEAVGAKVTIATSATDSKSYSLQDFLSVAMTTSVIVSMEIPFLTTNEQFKSFKVMPRAQNAHAYVNAGFRIKVDPTSLTVSGIPSFVFGGIAEHGVHATMTENYLIGKSLDNVQTLQTALVYLQKELVPDTPPVAASAKYRKSLACSLFYKFYLSCIPNKLTPRVRSAAIPYVRPLSSGVESYQTDPSQYPVTQSLPKLSALLQASGEAKYTTDVPALPEEVHAAFVLSTIGNAKILSVDPTPALAFPGVLRYVTADDIPAGGQNNALSTEFYKPEEVFAAEVSQYAGQAIGMILADTQEHANLAAQAVKATYQTMGPPIITIADAIKQESFFPDPPPLKVGDAQGAIAKATHKLSGEVSCGTQYHFTMETQTSVVVPEEDGYTVHASTQWIQLAQSSVALILGVPANSVNVTVKRVGGGYGSKISRSHQITAACALGAHLTQRPVRMHMDIDSNMEMVGKRIPFYTEYQVGFDDSGRISGILLNMYNNCGYVDNDNTFAGDFLYGFIDNAYNIANWLLLPKSCKTNLPCNTYCRSPGSVPATFVIETVMEHVGQSLGIPFEQVRYVNMYNRGDVTPLGVPLTYCSIKTIWADLLASADVQLRQQAVTDYNMANRWRKRGLGVVPLKFSIEWDGIQYTVFVSIYSEDGTVAIAHAGIEIGQGINTKVAQAAAKTLGVPLDYITVKPSNSLTGPNGSSTGGSISSELNVLGTLQACEELNTRIEAVRKKMSGQPTWKEVIRKCYDERVDLSAKAYVNETTKYAAVYFSYGACAVEAELDVLTGQAEILRTDILFDCGQSINPEMDIGQVHGAFVMGLGYWLTEEAKFDAESGRLLTHNTWEYKPPSSKDIPIDFRVSLLKDAPNPVGVLRSKACGEPPQCMSCAAIFALKRAIQSARAEIGNKDYFTLSGPATVEVLQQACLVDPSQFTF